MKKNDGTCSNQSIALDDRANVQSTMPKMESTVMGNVREKKRVARDGAASKIFIAWIGIFLPR